MSNNDSLGNDTSTANSRRVNILAILRLLLIITFLLVITIAPLGPIIKPSDKSLAKNHYKDNKETFLYIAEQLSEIELAEDEYFVAQLSWDGELQCFTLSTIGGDSTWIFVNSKLESSLYEVFGAKDTDGERLLRDIEKFPNTKRQIILTYSSSNWIDWDQDPGIIIDPDKGKLKINSAKKIVNEDDVIVQEPDNEIYALQIKLLRKIDDCAYYFEKKYIETDAYKATRSDGR